jgi:hypothetical protein
MALWGGSGKDHADGLPAAIGRERPEKEVDGKVRPGLVAFRRGKLQDALLDRHLGARRDHVHPVRLDPSTVLRLRDLHGGCLGERIAEQARPRRFQVLDQDQRETGVWRKARKELPEGFETAGGRTHADHRERGGRSRAPGDDAHLVEWTRRANVR